MQGKGDKGQKGRYIFTPLHTSGVAWRGFYICDFTGREHTQEKKKKQAQRKIKKMNVSVFYCIDHRQSGQLYLKFKRALHSTPEDKSK